MNTDNVNLSFLIRFGIRPAVQKGLREGALGRISGRLHVETHMFDVARLVDEHQVLGERLDLVL